LALVALLQQWLGTTIPPATLLARASCFNCLTPGQLDLVIAGLLCSIWGGGSGPPPVVKSVVIHTTTSLSFLTDQPAFAGSMNGTITTVNGVSPALTLTQFTSGPNNYLCFCIGDSLTVSSWNHFGTHVIGTTSAYQFIWNSNGGPNFWSSYNLGTNTLVVTGSSFATVASSTIASGAVVGLTSIAGTNLPNP
jgi:hypothetical protein